MAPNLFRVLFVLALSGFALAIWRLRVNDGLGGAAFGFGGILLLLFLATRLSNSK